MEIELNIKLSAGVSARFRRIMELKGYTEREALDYSIALGWLSAEQSATRRKAEGK